MIPKPPITAQDLPPEWPGMIRKMVNERDGVPIRANPQRACIEVWSVNRGRFQALMLPGGGECFTSFDERNAVLKLILEGAPNAN